ncbi:MAG: FIST N-terminal domain-containing protein, partial [Bradyrhizobium sp.]|nr:FIST N-terminal domain-containing protein [Bradyrhizobium sp.]
MLSLFSKNSQPPSQPVIARASGPETPELRDAQLIRVLDTDDRLDGVSADSFKFDGAASPLAFAFVSPHLDFARITSELRRLAGATTVIAVSTAGELCAASPATLYKPTGNRWSSVVVQVFPADLFQAVSVHAVPLQNEDIRKGAPSLPHDARIEAIVRSLSSIRTPFGIDVRDTLAFTLVDGVSASENYVMEAVYRAGKFPCAFVGGSAGGKLDFKNTYLFDGSRVIENHALMIFMK